MSGEAQRRWREENPDKVRAQRLRAKAKRVSRHSGLSRAERDRLLAEQGGRCAVCGADSPGEKGWHGDHDHRTGRVRGVLCRACNLGLGFFRDSEAALLLAVGYLRRHRESQ